MGKASDEFAEQVDEHLNRLGEELRAQSYQPQPVRQALIPKQGKAGRIADARHTVGLRQGVSAGVA